MKLGEVLVKEGLITKEHLMLALERQVIFGGRIGTNIVELGILTEDEFTKFLSRHLKIPVAEPSQLMTVFFSLTKYILLDSVTAFSY
ncbi:MAG: hypothetical protein Q8N12_06725 [Thermodesulfovibrionales bacterium]|nr:hypothetical protein [Nitrospinota bacterium]MCG2710286.1 hypothetical protein [Thermodesulfovibrionales bacterium]MDP3049106.1 hypothetical protein [Thermodesulfovibrionales bacterium]